MKEIKKAIEDLQSNIDLPFGYTVSDETSEIAIKSLEKQIKMSEALERLEDINNKSMYDNLAIRILKEFLVS